MSDRWLTVEIEPPPPEPRRRSISPASPPPRRPAWSLVAGVVVILGLATAIVGAWLVAASVMRWSEISRDAATAGQDLGSRSQVAAADLAAGLAGLQSTASTLDDVAGALDAAANIAADLEAVARGGLPSGPDGVAALVREIDLLAEAIDAAFPGLAELGVAEPDGPGNALQAAGEALISAADSLVPEAIRGFGPFVLRYPLPGHPVTTPFGTATGDGFHGGVDMAAPAGTPILAADDGVVLQAGWLDEAAGNGVILQHDQGWETRYFHMSTADLPVAAGDTVAAGQVIGNVGSTGESTGPHLHFEIVYGPIRLDPESGFTYVGSVAVDVAGEPAEGMGSSAPVPVSEASSSDDTVLSDTPTAIAGVQRELAAIAVEASNRANILEHRRLDEQARGETAALLLYGGAITMAVGLLLWLLRPRERAATL